MHLKHQTTLVSATPPESDQQMVKAVDSLSANPKSKERERAHQEQVMSLLQVWSHISLKD